MENQVTIPFKYTPRPYQLPFLRAMDSGIKRAAITWHRRSGKDKTTWNYTIKRATQEVGTYFYFLPTYTQAKKVIWDGMDKDGFRFLDHIPKELLASKNETEMRIELKNGSIIQLVGADNIDRIVGTNPIGVVFSEYSIMKPTVWDLIRPILTENGGWAIFIFTPRGKNHAWKLMMQAQGDSDKWFAQILTVKETNAISKEALESEAKEMPQDLFNQEFNCEFIEGAGQFFRNFNACVTREKAIIDPTHTYHIGVDLAKYQDYTVVTVIDLSTFDVVEIERFNQIDYTLQKARIEACSLRYTFGGRKPLINIDSTGVGEPIYDDLARRGLNVNPFKFTEQSRWDLLTNLQLKLEGTVITIPENQVLLNELGAMQYQMSERGKLKVAVPEGTHDDTIMSLGLAVWEMPNNRVLARVGSIRNLSASGGMPDTKIESYE